MTKRDTVNRYAQRKELERKLWDKVARGIEESVQRGIAESEQRRAARHAQHARDGWNDNHARIVARGGGIYKPGMLGDLVLFNSPATGSTLALHEADLTPEAVRRHIAESNAKFGVRE